MDQHQSNNSDAGNKKNQQLDNYRVDHENTKLTTNQGVPVTNTDDSLKAGERGPTLMEDFHFREKMTHFDHERIPERVVHARGFGLMDIFKFMNQWRNTRKLVFYKIPPQRHPCLFAFPPW
nr:catalase [Thalassobacillus sp. C254]